MLGAKGWTRMLHVSVQGSHNSVEKFLTCSGTAVAPKGSERPLNGVSNSGGEPCCPDLSSHADLQAYIRVM